MGVANIEYKDLVVRPWKEMESSEENKLREKKEKKRAYDKKWRENNKEKNLASMKKWRENNKEKINEYKKTPAGMKDYISKCRHGHTWTLEYSEYKQLLEGKCYYCGSNEKIGIDRIINEIGYESGNCVSCCKHCNSGKGEGTAEEYFARCARVAEKHDLLYVQYEDDESDESDEEEEEYEEDEEIEYIEQD